MFHNGSIVSNRVYYVSTTGKYWNDCSVVQYSMISLTRNEVCSSINEYYTSFLEVIA